MIDTNQLLTFAQEARERANKVALKSSYIDRRYRLQISDIEKIVIYASQDVPVLCAIVENLVAEITRLAAENSALRANLHEFKNGIPPDEEEGIKYRIPRYT